MSIFKGWFGEIKTTFWMWVSLDSQIYNRFHDTIIPSSNGTTQIDHILISRYGIFIVETKNKAGWIFGGEDQANWTQVVYGKKYSFQNPLRQTYRQKKILAQFIEVDESHIYPVIYFAGDSKFKTQLPPNVLNSGIGSYIKGFRDLVLSQDEVYRIIAKIGQHTNESQISNSDHVRSLHQRHNSTTNCPKCGGSLKLREAKSGSRVGFKFLGCENYPRCRFTRNA